MARPLRLEYAGALYHVTARGNRRGALYFDDADRHHWLGLLKNTRERFNWLIHAYCQMTNHYHLLIETPEGNLSRGMRQLNGSYSLYSNRRHVQVGHVFQGRYKAILVQKDAYCRELSRYIVLNPVRAGMVDRAEDWPWSSYSATIGRTQTPEWLETNWLLAQFGTTEQHEAVARYRRFVAAGRGLPSPLAQCRHQFILGDENFVEQHRATHADEPLLEVSKPQRRAVLPSLHHYQERYNNRDHAMAQAYLSGAYTMQQVAAHFRVHYVTVSRAVKRLEVVKS